MSEQRHYEVELMDKPLDRWLRVLTTIASATTAFAVVVGIWLGFREIRDVAKQMELQTEQLGLQNQQLALQRQTIEDEWRQRFFDHQMDIYRDVVTTAGRIAVLRQNADDPNLKSEIENFLTQFWGQMCIVEGDEVEQAMILFRKGVKEELAAEDIEQLAVNLAHVCRNETNTRYFLTDEDRRERESRFGTNEELLGKMRDLVKTDG